MAVAILLLCENAVEAISFISVHLPLWWDVKSIAELRTAERAFKAQFFSKEKSS